MFCSCCVYVYFLFRKGCVPTPPCTSPGMCPYDGQYCFNGRCKLIVCREDNECMGTEVCINGACEDKPCVGSECFTCSQRACQYQPCMIGDICQTFIRCKTSRSCPQHMECKYNEIVQGKTCQSRNCSEDTECFPGKCLQVGIRKEKICFTPTDKHPPCQDDCPKKETCFMGNCFPPNCAEKDSANCKKNCRSYGTKVVCPIKSPPCEDTRDCLPGFRCSPSKTCTLIECYMHEHCTRPEDICLFGECVTRTTLISCSVNNPCPSQLTCLGSVCITYTFCSADNDCQQPQYKCEVLFASRYQRGICIPKVKCDNDNVQPGTSRNGCPVNMRCTTAGVCETNSCDSTSADCGWGLKCKDLKQGSEKNICFPDILCRSKSDCDEDQTCDLKTGTCFNIGCQKCRRDQACEKNVCIDRWFCNNKRCPPRHVCKNGQCSVDTGICMTDAQCPRGTVCWAGVCVAQPPCEKSKCPSGQDCHPKLKICVFICDKDQKNCPSDYICQEKLKICIVSMSCVTDFNCPIDMMCRYENQACSGQDGCRCVPRDDCKCNRGECIKDEKLCTVTRKDCAECPENFICPKFSKELKGQKDKAPQHCIPICNRKDPTSCPPSQVCIADMEGKYGCVTSPPCGSDSCPPPLTCQGGYCEPPECYTDSDCSLYHICYSNLCQRLPPICTRDQQCQVQPCLKSPKSTIGLCNDCQGRCGQESCKAGLCESVPPCSVDAHCDAYHECKNGTCTVKSCEKCRGKVLHKILFRLAYIISK